MKLSVISDVHLGVLRSAGTTPATAMALRASMLQKFDELLQTIGNDLLINGDLFDKESIPLSDMLTAYRTLAGWLAANPSAKLWGSPGNHDLSKNSASYSSFQFVMQLLCGLCPNRVTYISDLTEIYPGIWVLPHLPNQDRLNVALQRVPECDILFVHTNYENNFAAQSDQSLNISAEQAARCEAKYIVFGHEHQQRTGLEGKVLIPGNQIASSVSDCLGSATRYMVEVDDDNVPRMKELPPFSFKDMRWDELEDSEAEFIRISGSATADQGAEVVQKIARYRTKSQAFVVSNAVTMLGEDGRAEEFAVSMESVRSFDVLAALKKLLTAEEAAAIEDLPKD